MTPLNNKYTKYYNELVKSRNKLNRVYKPGCGFEKHHIIPKSLGGSNEKSNLVTLTPREHCVAHMLLIRMYSGAAKGKMCYALMCLFRMRNKHRESLTAREYERMRVEHMKAIMAPESRALRSELTKKQWTPERKQRQIERMKAKWADPNSLARATYSSEEYRKKKSKQMKDRWQDPNYVLEQSTNAKKQWENGGSLRDR